MILSKLNAFAIQNLLVFVLVFSFLVINTESGIAGNTVTYEGTIQGLDCVHYKKKCPEEDLDMYISLERDFVLLSTDGRHFLLPNIDRHIKVKYLTKAVRISGNQKESSILVNKFEV